jgi:hypothetical protein
MARMSRVWIPVLVGLLVAVLLGPAGVTAVEPRTVTASIMVPAAAFIPTSDNVDYSNASALDLDTGTGGFTALLSFPVAEVNIKRITLYAHDENSAARVCVSLRRSRPADGLAPEVGRVCTVDSADLPQSAFTTAISPRQVDTAFHGPFLWVSLSGPGVWFYGVKITYSYEAGA